MTEVGSCAIPSSVIALQKPARPATWGIPAGVPFFTKEVFLYAEAFITYDQQISLLKSKHLIITDEDAAKRVLAQIGYFSLIGGYKHPFKNKTTKM